jgi:anti-sigma regulatory factor (Ser/Thr protein kinase)
LLHRSHLQDFLHSPYFRRIRVSVTDAFINFVLPSHPRYLSVVRAAVGELSAVSGLRPEECRGVIRAVDEAMANVIRHAYLGSADRQIEVCCQALRDRLVFTLMDCGQAPDPARLAPHPLDEVSLSGRGTHIIRSIMDEVCYEQVSGVNRLRLSKRLPAAEAAPGAMEGAYERCDPH